MRCHSEVVTSLVSVLNLNKCKLVSATMGLRGTEKIRSSLFLGSLVQLGWWTGSVNVIWCGEVLFHAVDWIPGERIALWGVPPGAPCSFFQAEAGVRVVWGGILVEGACVNKPRGQPVPAARRIPHDHRPHWFSLCIKNVNYCVRNRCCWDCSWGAVNSYLCVRSLLIDSRLFSFGWKCNRGVV